MDVGCCLVFAGAHGPVREKETSHVNVRVSDIDGRR